MEIKTKQKGKKNNDIMFNFILSNTLWLMGNISEYIYSHWFGFGSVDDNNYSIDSDV